MDANITGDPLSGDIHEQSSPRHSSWYSLAVALGLRALVRPRLALDLLRLAWAFRKRHWYKQFPFMPLPSREYMRWRMHTAYGDEAAVPPTSDVIRFARWRREVMRL